MLTIDQKAPVVTQDQEFINAPIDVLWPIFTNVSEWTYWNKDIKQAQLEGPLQIGSTIHWTTAGMVIESTIGELVHPHCIVWSGLTQGIMGIHHWQFTPVTGGTLVQTEESWSGEPVEAYPATMQQRTRLLTALLSNCAWEFTDNMNYSKRSLSTFMPTRSTSEKGRTQRLRQQLSGTNGRVLETHLGGCCVAFPVRQPAALLIPNFYGKRNAFKARR